jgi:enamine deaminase RidA (YjgF/YER057c/UK114 family)
MIDQRLQELGITLPPFVPPLYSYIAVKVHRGVARVSGQVPRVEGAMQHPGKVGAEVSIEQAREAAEICTLRALSALRHSLGSLDRVEQVLSLNGFVSSTPDFIMQPKVIDAASELLERVFGEAGKHTRTAVGVASLPNDAPVMIDFTFAVTDE